MILFALILLVECIILWQGQRRLFFLTVDATGMHWIAYILAAPGTILHEASHFIACLLLGVPAGGAVGERVKFFRPERHEDGSITLGYVPHAQTDPLRGALIAMAPVLLVPPILILISMALLGGNVLEQPLMAIADASPWKVAVWFYISLSCGQAAFPSPGDHIGFFGGVFLILIAIAAGQLFYASQGSIDGLLRFCALVLAPSAIASLLSFLIFLPLARRRMGR